MCRRYGQAGGQLVGVRAVPHFRREQPLLGGGDRQNRVGQLLQREDSAGKMRAGPMREARPERVHAGRPAHAVPPRRRPPPQLPLREREAEVPSQRQKDQVRA